MSRLYALLVGINAYDDAVGKLQGCVNDAADMQAYLRETWPAEDLAIEVLLDEDATRPAIMRQFREHLGRAGKGDVALFHYCGHGAKARAAQEFDEWSPRGKDEGLVCIDSRRGDNFDLADKELAVLIAEVAAREPHLAVVLDCCHSGSGTRDLDEADGLTARVTHEKREGRAFESYADGWYADLVRRGEPLRVPASRHILLAACEWHQKAKERADHRGVFTAALTDVLRASGGVVTYPELFMRARAAARAAAKQQDPQFEAIGGFDAWTGFLARGGEHVRPRYYLAAKDGAWSVECGAVHGLPVDASTPATFAIFAEGGTEPVGHAAAAQVGAQRSAVTLDFAPDPAAAYRAEVTSLPAPPMLVGFTGDPAHRAALESALAQPSADPVALTQAGQDRAHQLVAEGDTLQLRRRGDGSLVQSVPLSGDWITPTLALLRHVARWERTLALANPRPRIDPALVEFRFESDTAQQSGAETTVRYAGQPIRGKLRVANRTDQPLHAALFYFSAAYGIHAGTNEEVPAGAADVTRWGGEPGQDLYLDDGQAEALERFKLLVSTEKVDDFLLTQDPLEIGRRTTRGVGGFGTVRKPVENDWFAHDLAIRVVRD